LLPSNSSSISARFFKFQLHNLIPNTVASLNIPSMYITLDTSQDDILLLNADAESNINSMFVTLDTFQQLRSLLNDWNLTSPSSPPTVSRGPTSSPTVTFLPIEGSTCSDTCGSERELVNNDNIQERILEYSDEGKMKKIHCLDTSKITNMDYVLSGSYNTRFQSFSTDLSCWDVSSVTAMTVSTWSLEYHFI